MAVCRIYCHRVDACCQQHFQAILQVLTHPNRSSDQELASAIRGGVGKILLLEDVLVGNEAAQIEMLVYQRQFLDAVLVELGLGFFQ